MSEQEIETKEPTAAERLAEKVTGQSVGDAKPEDAEAEKALADAVSKDGAEAADEDEPEEAPESADERPMKADGTPYTKADIDGLQTALRASRKEAREYKAQLEELKAKGGDRPLDEVIADAEANANARWKPLMVRAAARAAFAEAGLALPEGRQEEAFARAVRLLDEDALTITDDGQVEGLTEQVEALRRDFPDLFGVQRKPRIQAADRPTGPKPQPSAADQLAAALVGRRAS